MDNDAAMFDRHALSDLLSRNDVSLAVLEELFGSPETGRELLHGDRLPSLHEATLLGALLGVDPTVLTGTKRPSLGVSLRLGTAQVEHDVVKPVEHAMKLLAADRLTAEWGFDGQAQDLSSLPVSRRQFKAKEDGQLTADRLRALLRLDPVDPIEDLTRIVESLGHVVEYRPLPENVHGISVPETRGNRKTWAVLINSDDYWARQRFSLAHELSHIVYQDSGQFIVDRAQNDNALPEIIADSFARHFLLPDDALEQTLDDHGPSKDLLDVKHLVANIVLTYGISRQATIKALRDSDFEWVPSGSLLDRCESESVASMMALVGAGEDWTQMEQARGRRCASAQLTARVLDAFAQELVSLATVADVIADGDQSDAGKMLTAAGWDLHTAAER